MSKSSAVAGHLGEERVKKIEAIIRHFRLEDVKNELVEANVHGMTVTEVRGFGRQKGHKETYRGTEYSVEFVPKIKLEIVCADADMQSIVDTIVEKSKTGKVGDGKIFVSDLADSIRIRTGESGEEAL